MGYKISKYLLNYNGMTHNGISVSVKTIKDNLRYKEKVTCTTSA